LWAQHVCCVLWTRLDRDGATNSEADQSVIWTRDVSAGIRLDFTGASDGLGHRRIRGRGVARCPAQLSSCVLRGRHRLRRRLNCDIDDTQAVGGGDTHHPRRVERARDAGPGFNRCLTIQLSELTLIFQASRCAFMTAMRFSSRRAKARTQLSRTASCYGPVFACAPQALASDGVGSRHPYNPSCLSREVMMP